MSAAVPGVRPSVSVVIPTYQRRGVLESILRPLLSDRGATEVIVVSDGTTDGTVEWLTHQATLHPRLRVLDRPHGGRQAARRAGIEAATEEVVLLLDDDVLASEGMVTKHAELHRSGELLVVEGSMPIMLPSVLRPGMAPTAIYAQEYLAHQARLSQNPQLGLLEMWGGNISLPRSLALGVTAGAEFPASFGEDTHFGLLCRQAGARGVFDVHSGATHLHSRSLKSFLLDGEQQGIGRWWLHHLYAKELGTFEPTDVLKGLPRGFAPLIRVIGHQPRGWMQKFGPTLASSVGRRGWLGGEIQLARLLRRVSMYDGAWRAEQLHQAGSETTGS